MATITRFEDLEIWQEARVLSKEIFEITYSRDFPRDFGFIKQINNASGSTMDNIAEGFERGSRLEFINLLSYAKGSAGEVRSQLYRGLDRKYFSEEVFKLLFERTIKISNKTASLSDYLNKSTIKGKKFNSRG